MEMRSDPQTSQEPASLVLRLAGPSTTKAGLSAEQSEINRIIAEASKGSKFYENEKRKDKEVTARIGRILKLRNQSMKGVDMGEVEQKVDHLLEAIERERDLTQFIVHVDMDAFYANVELLDNPGLAGKAFGVGHGILTTASYEARTYGVRSGMPGHIAQKLCPDLIFVDLHMSRYSEMSKRIMAIFKQYDPNMLGASVDEAYLNITDYCVQHNLDPDECVQQMRQRVFDETKLTVSAGIAANKMLAKICSDKNKPNGQFHLSHTSGAVKDFMWDLPIRKIPGIGRVSERLLDSIGVTTCGDIFKCRGVLSLLDKQFGLRSMLRIHLGIASNVVQPWAREDKKSIGSERTFKATSEKEKILQKLEDIAAELEDDMESGGWTGRTITLKYKLDTYEVFTRAKSFNRWIKTKAELYEAGKELLQPEWPLCLRLIGLRVTKLKDLRKKEGGIGKFFEPLPGSPSKKGRAYDSDDSRDSDFEFIELDPNDDGLNHSASDGESEPLPKPHASTHGYHRPPPPMFAPSAPSSLPSMPSPSKISSEIRGTEMSMTGSVQRAMVSSASERDAVVFRNRKQPRGVGGPSELLDHDMRGGDGDAGCTIAQKPPSDRAARARPGSTRTSAHVADAAAVGECPLCTRSFADNDELNAHIDWCLSREAIRSAQVEGDGRTKERRKLEVGLRQPKEWWKGGSVEEGAAQSRKPKRRKL